MLDFFSTNTNHCGISRPLNISKEILKDLEALQWKNFMKKVSFVLFKPLFVFKAFLDNLQKAKSFLFQHG